jgi:hypothetical protein
MKESLTCTSCASTWKRDKTRGRKPHLCPKCVRVENAASVKPVKQNLKKDIVKRGRKAKPIIETDNKSEVKIDTEIKNKTTSDLTVSKVMQSFHPKSSNHEELRESTKNGSTWKCTNCGNILKLEISITDIPTHRCTPNMVSVKPYERIK